MSQWLKQSTSITLRIGPFLDSTDGDTVENGLTIANTDIRISKNGGAFGDKNAGGATIDENGWYSMTLDGTDTATLGLLDVCIHVAGALAVWRHFEVLKANVFDSFVAGSDILQVEANELTGSAVTAVNTECDTALSDINLDHLLKVAAVAGDAVDSSIIARMTSKSATPSFASFSNVTDSLEGMNDGLTAYVLAKTSGITSTLSNLINNVKVILRR